MLELTVACVAVVALALLLSAMLSFAIGRHQPRWRWLAVASCSIAAALSLVISDDAGAAWAGIGCTILLVCAMAALLSASRAALALAVLTALIVNCAHVAFSYRAVDAAAHSQTEIHRLDADPLLRWCRKPPTHVAAGHVAEACLRPNFTYWEHWSKVRALHLRLVVSLLAALAALAPCLLIRAKQSP